MFPKLSVLPIEVLYYFRYQHISTINQTQNLTKNKHGKYVKIFSIFGNYFDGTRDCCRCSQMSA